MNGETKNCLSEVWRTGPRGVVAAAKADRALLKGINTHGGHVTCEPVAQAQIAGLKENYILRVRRK